MRTFLSVEQAALIAKRHESDLDWDFWAMTVEQIWAELLVLEAQNDAS